MGTELESLRRQMEALERETMDGDVPERRKLEIRGELTKLRSRLEGARDASEKARE